MGTERNYTIDIIRIIASIGVIAIHVQASSDAAASFQLFFSPLSVPFFYTASLTYFIYGLKTSSGANPKSALYKIGERIGLPFFGWTLIYLFFLIVKNIALHQHKDFSFYKIFIYGETSVQLYYLPSLIAMQLLTLACYLFIYNRKYIFIATCCFIVGLTYFIVGDYYNCFGVSSSGQYFGITLFILMSFYLSNKLKGNNTQTNLFIIGFVLLIITKIPFVMHSNLSIYGYSMLFPVGGIALMLIGLGYKIKHVPNWVKSISSATYGIYLCHILFLESFEFLLKSILKINLYYDLSVKLLVVGLIFCLSYFFTLFLKKFKITKYILLGEK